MKNPKFYKGLQKLRRDMKPMTFWEKLDHLWSYYKEYLAVAFLVLAFLAATVTGFVNAGRKTLLSGLMCNVSMSVEGYNYLTEDYFALKEGNRRQDVTLQSAMFDLSILPEKVNENYQATMHLVALVEAKKLDYMILNKTAMEFYIAQEVYMDLREFFTAEEMQQWEKELIYVQEEGGEPYPAIINISQLSFAKDCITSEEGVYLTFAANTPRKDACREVWAYILAWGGENPAG